MEQVCTTPASSSSEEESPNAIRMSSAWHEVPIAYPVHMLGLRQQQTGDQKVAYARVSCFTATVTNTNQINNSRVD